MKIKLKHYETNHVGKDYVVGDLHGCYDELMILLDHVKFDKTIDRLFSVGDLVDRGPKNIECAGLLFEEWFFCVQGNHEDLMHGSILENKPGYIDCWIGNGGMWQLGQDPALMLNLAEKMKSLPLVITVGDTGVDRFNIVHGELYHDGMDESGLFKRIPLTDQMIDNWVFDSYQENNMMWGRDLCTRKVVAYKFHDAEKMSITFVGHTPMRAVVQYGQQMYIDCGGVFFHHSKSQSHDNAIILVQPKTKTVYRYGMVMANITEKHFDEVEKWAQ